MPLAYTGIRVTDLDRSIAFYTGPLGLTLLRRGTMSHGGQWVLLEDPSTHQRLELNFYPPGNRFHVPFTPGEGLDHIGFEVDDARGLVARLLERGATLAVDPWEEAPGLWVGYVRDPDGNWVEVYELGNA